MFQEKSFDFGLRLSLGHPTILPAITDKNRNIWFILSSQICIRTKKESSPSE